MGAVLIVLALGVVLSFGAWRGTDCCQLLMADSFFPEQQAGRGVEVQNPITTASSPPRSALIPITSEKPSPSSPSSPLSSSYSHAFAATGVE